MGILNITCPTCRGIFNNTDDVYSTSCGHLFHLSCSNEWLRIGKCPQCQRCNTNVHKLYLSFESEEDSVTQKELDLELKNSNEKIIQLGAEISESETNLLYLQKQFHSVEKSKRILEGRIRHLNETENNFLNMQAQYTEASERIKELQDHVTNLLIERETETKEVHNELFIEGLEADHSTLRKEILNKIVCLEQTFKTILASVEKEVVANTKLQIENMRLKSLIDHYSEKITTTPRKRDKENASKPEMKRSSKQNIDDNLNSVIIKGLGICQIEIPLDNVVINLASKMDLSISTDDLIKTVFIAPTELESFKANLLAQFKSTELKKKFLLRKNILKNDPTTKQIVIDNFMGNTFSLFKYAKENLLRNGFPVIVMKDNKIVAKRSLKQRRGVFIESQAQVDAMRKIHTEIDDNCVDENFYQL